MKTVICALALVVSLSGLAADPVYRCYFRVDGDFRISGNLFSQDIHPKSSTVLGLEEIAGEGVQGFLFGYQLSSGEKRLMLQLRHHGMPVASRVFSVPEPHPFIEQEINGRAYRVGCGIRF